MVVKDGIPFHLFTTSKDLSAALGSYGIDVPASTNTIKERVLQLADFAQQKYEEEFALAIHDLQCSHDRSIFLTVQGFRIPGLNIVRCLRPLIATLLTCSI